MRSAELGLRTVVLEPRPARGRSTRARCRLPPSLDQLVTPPVVGRERFRLSRVLHNEAAAQGGEPAFVAEWIRKSRIRSGLRAGWLALFEDVDVVLCPPMPTVAFPHDHSPQFARQLDIDGVKVPYNDQSVWAGIALLSGLPATTMPVSRTKDGLPIGMQIIGNYLDDRTTIAFAGLVEREFGGFTPPPHL